MREEGKSPFTKFELFQDSIVNHQALFIVKILPIFQNSTRAEKMDFKVEELPYV